jgi:hypothetical protein
LGAAATHRGQHPQFRHPIGLGLLGLLLPVIPGIPLLIAGVALWAPIIHGSGQ